MLKRANRLRKRYQFNYVYKAGQHFSGKAVTIYATTSKTKCVKVGFAVTKKIGHAITRNLFRRRLREIVRKQLPNLKQNYNIIVVAREQIVQFDYKFIECEIISLLEKANLYKNEENFKSDN